MKNSKNTKMYVRHIHESHFVKTSDSARKKISDQMWIEAVTNGSKAKELLVNLEFPNGARVKEAKLENGNSIPISEITDEQALKCVREFAPDRIMRGIQ